MRTSTSWSARAAASCRARTISRTVTTLIVDAAGPGVTAWPADDDAWVGDPVSAGSVEAAIAQIAAGPLRICIDGAADAGVLCLPCAMASVRSTCRTGQVGAHHLTTFPALEAEDGAVLRGVARALGAFRLVRGAGSNSRPLLICDCRSDGSVAWLHVAEEQVQRVAVNPIARRLAELLARQPGDARDEDDDVAYERGLTLAEDGSDPEGDLDRALQRIAAGETQPAAAGALLAGVLIGHDCARGLRLGRLGGPMALVGSGLLAERYSVALARFGVAVRRIAPVRAIREGCRP